jgi:prepilin-type N-terminal cleavage/methylation domain-containing protein
MVERRQTAGFTLIEMMVALGILLVGVTTLLTVLGDSMSLRRTSEGRIAAGLIAEDVLHQIQSQGFQRKPAATSPLDLELRSLDDQPVPGVPGGTWSVAYAEDETRPDIVLATVKVRWLEQGDSVQQEFQAILPKSEPFAARVQRWRQEHRSAR